METYFPVQVLLPSLALSSFAGVLIFLHELVIALLEGTSSPDESPESIDKDSRLYGLDLNGSGNCSGGHYLGTALRHTTNNLGKRQR